MSTSYTEWAKSRYTVIQYILYTVYLLLAHPVYRKRPVIKIRETHVQKVAHFRYDITHCTNNANVKKELNLNTKEKGSSVTGTGGEMIRTSPK
jgi:hypothetical protein